MSSPVPFDQLMANMDKLDKNVSAHAANFDGPARELLEHLLGVFRKAKADIARDLPAVLQEFKATAERLKAEAEQGLVEVEKLREKAAKPPEPPEPPPAPPAPQPDLHLGQDLRRELLTRYEWIEPGA